MEQHTKIHGNFQREPPRGQGEPPREARPSHLDPTRGRSRSEGSNGVKRIQRGGSPKKERSIDRKRPVYVCVCVYIYNIYIHHI